MPILSSGVSLVCLTFVVCALRASYAEKTEACMQDGAIRLRGERRNETCGFITGIVEVCESSRWVRICDDHWTVEDARVVCRDVGYLSIGAVNLMILQMGSMQADYSSFLRVCSGSELEFANCSSTEADESLLSNCMTIARVQCYFNESSAALCGGIPSTMQTTPETESSSTATAVPTTPRTVSATSVNTNQENTTVADTTATTPPSDVNTTTDPSTSLQTYHYGVIGAVAFLIILILLTSICLLVVCVKNSRRKKLKERISTLPGATEEDQKNEMDEIRYHPDPTNTLTNEEDEDPIGSQNDPSTPIYEAIDNNPPPPQQQSADVESPLVPSKQSPTETDPLCTGAGTYASLERHVPQYQTLEAFTGSSNTSRTSLPTHHPTDSTYSHYLELDRSFPRKKKKTTSASDAMALHRQNSTGAQPQVLSENEYSTVTDSKKKQQRATASLDRRNPAQLAAMEAKYRHFPEEVGPFISPADETLSSQQHTYATLEPPPPEVLTQQQRYPISRVDSANSHQTMVSSGRGSGEIDLGAEERGSSKDCMDTLV